MSTSKYQIDQDFKSHNSDSNSLRPLSTSMSVKRSSQMTASWLSIACIAIAFICFLPRLSALFPATEAHASSESKVDALFTTKPIEEIWPGDRVLAHNPEVTEKERAIPFEIDRENWRLIEMLLTGEDGHQVNVRLLRSVWWIDHHQAKKGGQIKLDLEELGVTGYAGILSIKPCPEIAPEENGQVVTGTFQHVADNIVRVHLKGSVVSSGPITCTSGHLFWSVDRNKFVPAESLLSDELLSDACGEHLQISHVENIDGSSPVFNLEVAIEHVYYVSESGILVHNATPTSINFVPNVNGVYVLENRTLGTAYVGESSGASPGLGMKQRMSSGRHAHAQNLLGHPDTVIKFLPVDLKTLQGQRDRSIVMKRIESQQMARAENRGLTLLNNSANNPSLKTPATMLEADTLMRKHGIEGMNQQAIRANEQNSKKFKRGENGGC